MYSASILDCSKVLVIEHGKLHAYPVILWKIAVLYDIIMTAGQSHIIYAAISANTAC